MALIMLLLALLPPTDFDGSVLPSDRAKASTFGPGRLSVGLIFPTLSFPSLMEMLFAWAHAAAWRRIGR